MNNNELKVNLRIGKHLAPIKLFVYNRLNHVRQSVASWRANVLAKDSDLYIYADGPKHERAHAAVTEMRHYIRCIDGFRSVHLIKSDENLGLARSIIVSVSDKCSRYDRVEFSRYQVKEGRVVIQMDGCACRLRNFPKTLKWSCRMPDMSTSLMLVPGKHIAFRLSAGGGFA